MSDAMPGMKTDFAAPGRGKVQCPIDPAYEQVNFAEVRRRLGGDVTASPNEPPEAEQRSQPKPSKRKGGRS